MMRDLLFKLIINTLIKLNGDEVMMALLLAQRIILGKLEFSAVPSTLKLQVYEILKESGVEYLAGDYVPPTPDPEPEPETPNPEPTN